MITSFILLLFVVVPIFTILCVSLWPFQSGLSFYFLSWRCWDAIILSLLSRFHNNFDSFIFMNFVTKVFRKTFRFVYEFHILKWPKTFASIILNEFVLWIYLACVNGMIVGGFGGCCGTIRPRNLVGPLCGNDMSPADLSDIIPVPLLISSPFGCDVKHTRPSCNN